MNVCIVLLCSLLALGCGGERDTQEPPADEPEAAAITPAAVLADVDRRVAGPALETAASSSDPDLRRLAVLGAARLHAAENLPLLRAAIADPAPAVRDAASLGLGALEPDPPAEVERILLGALAAERDPPTRATMLFDLGRVSTEAAESAFREALSEADADVREGACRGIGNLGLRRRVPDAALLRRVGVRTHDDPNAAVRLACAYALTRVPPPPEASEEHGALLADLSAAATDPDPEVRAMAVRALGRYSGVPAALLEERATDSDWRVAVQAFRVLAHSPDGSWDGPLARASRVALDRALEGPLAGPRLHVLLTALQASEERAEAAPIRGVAQEAFDRMGEVPRGEPLSRDRGLAHCAAARVLDLGRRWPSRVESCGLEQVLPWEQQVAAAEILARVPGAEPQRVAYLRRLFAAEDVRVREAVLASAGTIADAGADRLVLEGLRSHDMGVVTAACDAVAAAAERWAAPPPDAPVLSVRPAGSPEPAPPAATGGPSTAALQRALRAARRTLATADDLEGLQSWLHAVVSTHSFGFLPQLREMAHHPNAALRSAATEALHGLGEQRTPTGESRPIPDPLSPESLAADVPGRVVLDTDRGRITIELLGSDAPTTTRRIAGLVRDGFYDGLTFHRVVAAFVVQGGDPRGDGYGGPGWSQRCEDNRVRYERGTVGMALAGRDTGGSQFFIAHSTQPHLDGRYTAFGRVVEGMDVVDQLQAGDRIRHARVE